MAGALRTGYAELFSHYPDAHNRSDAELEDYFSANTSVSGATVTFMARTFKALCKLADSEKMTSNELDAESGSQDLASGHAAGTTSPRVLPVAININIQLQLPATQDEGVYEKLFQSMKKHLLQQ